MPVFKGKLVSPFSFRCAAASSETPDFDPLRLLSFFIQAQNKKKGAPAIQRQTGLVSSSLFPSEPQGDQLPFEVPLKLGTE